MAQSVGAEPAGARLAEIHQLYALQSHLIDSGRAAEWAATFTDDGAFHSPSYPEPSVGTGQLTAFAEQFAADARSAGEVRRHVLTNLVVHPEEHADGSLAVEAYLQIVATPHGGAPRLVRFTTVSDRLVREGHAWRVAHRTVRRDDA
ncbi:nuclear transport factor 2 family protein [Streptomyces sulphureus]|uniref:nuclear transport factor 2 family protein n=1 Tax=Streptomyces sulphureus TaxID=47758 RepID=UPI00036B2896|nr:nuclear transport factor 2 family protein [Streptomyces sulphureus]